MVIVCINKNDTTQTAGHPVTHTAQFHNGARLHAHERRFRAGAQADIAITLTNAFQYAMPANSVTTLVWCRNWRCAAAGAPRTCGTDSHFSAFAYVSCDRTRRGLC